MIEERENNGYLRAKLWSLMIVACGSERSMPMAVHSGLGEKEMDDLESIPGLDRVAKYNISLHTLALSV